MVLSESIQEGVRLTLSHLSHRLVPSQCHGVVVHEATAAGHSSLPAGEAVMGMLRMAHPHCLNPSRHSEHASTPRSPSGQIGSARSKGLDAKTRLEACNHRQEAQLQRQTSWRTEFPRGPAITAVRQPMARHLWVPYELRDWYWQHQRTAYALLLRTAWLTVQAFGRPDPKLNGQMGAHAVLHTHNRRLEYHPHAHLIVPAGAVSKQHEQWRWKSGEYLFPVANLSRIYRAKWFDRLRLLGVEIRATLPSEWVVHCKAVGRGDKALAYLGRYMYRGVLPEKNILKDQDGSITFQTVDNEGAEIIQTLPGAESLWLLLRHVLPKCFRGVRDFGLLYGNTKAVVQLVQMLLNHIPFYPMTKAEKQPMASPECGRPIKVVAVRVREVALLWY